MNNKDHLVGQLTRCTFDMPSKSSGVHQVPVGTSGYQQVYQEDQDQISGATYISDVVFHI